MPRRYLLYYMSGTGNTFRVAHWLKTWSERAGDTLELQAIQTGCAPATDGAAPWFGFLMPTHAFTAPWPMLRFAWRLPRRTGVPAFVIVTRAGTKFGGRCWPGLEGTACYLMALVLALKGFRVRGVLGLDMPSNWIACHAGLRPDKVADILRRAEAKTERFFQCLRAGQRWFHGWISLLLGLALIPVSLGYLLMGRFFLAKLFFFNHRCTGCGLCARACPFHAIRMWGSRRRKRPYWTWRCENCMRCMAYCPLAAIEAGHSWAVLLHRLASLPSAAAVMGFLLPLLPWLGAIDGVVWRQVLAYGLYLATVFVAYGVFVTLIHIPPINALFTYTTFTHLYRRYHEPATKLRDLVDAEQAR